MVYRTMGHILCGLNLDRLIAKWINNPAHTAGWHRRYNNTGSFKITFVPSRHWANRGLLEAHTTLWGGFSMDKAGGCIYFSGDSGYGLALQSYRPFISPYRRSTIRSGSLCTCLVYGKKSPGSVPGPASFQGYRGTTLYSSIMAHSIWPMSPWVKQNKY